MNKAIMVVVNKWDLIEKDDKTLSNYQKDLQQKLKFMPYAKYLFISALTDKEYIKYYQQLNIVMIITLREFQLDY